jgi:hypothetical protein
MTFWQKVSERFTSTKFLMALAACVTSTVAFVKGEISAEVWIGSVSVVVSAWTMSQGRVDAADSRFRGTNPGA